MNELAVEIGRRVRRYRQAHGWSLKACARRMGDVNQYTHIVAIEHGRVAPRIHTLLAIAGALGVLITDLLPPMLTPSALVTWDEIVATGVEEGTAAQLVIWLRAIDHDRRPVALDLPTPPRSG
jgi:transcriptional regulator with XRE-family HTH domain